MNLKQQLRDNSVFLSLTFFTAIVFIFEIFFFYVVEYVYNYLQAVLIISYALLGITVGCLISSKINFHAKLFLYCAFGTVIACALALTQVLRLPETTLGNLLLMLPFVFPAIYTSTVYREYKSTQAYMFDMLGAMLGIVTSVALFNVMNVESSILLLLALTSIVALFHAKSVRSSLFPIIIAVIIASTTLLSLQLATDRFNLVRITKCGPETDSTKIFCRLKKGGGRYETHKLVKSYDNLVARIDVTQRKNDPNWHGVYFHSMMNDHFKNEKGYVFGKGLNLDRRVVTGVVDNPKILITGPSANGILKSACGWSSKPIIGVEINPSIIRMMTDDFYEESGRSYDAIDLKKGNMLSYLIKTKEKFDLITFINTRSMTSIGYLGPPDYIHTKESYGLYLNRLTEEGYVMFEERPVTQRGMEGVKRMLSTWYAALKENGSSDPEKHFFIYSWMSGKQIPVEHKIPDYISIMVTKRPLEGSALQSVHKWIGLQKWIKPVYLHNSFNNTSYAQFIREIKTGQTISLEQHVDYSPVTSDRPYSSQVYKDYPEITKVLKSLGLLCLIAIIILTTCSSRSCNKSNIALSAYNICIGIAYFLIEIVLMQKYQNIFNTPTTSLILVLGVMLLSSGIGALLLSKKNPLSVTFVLILIILANIYLPSRIVQLGLPNVLEYGLLIFMIFACGFMMGGFFPRGLIHAKEAGFKNAVPHYFGICSIAGTFGTVLSLYISVVYGYFLTLAIALGFYLVASLIIQAFGSRNKELS